VSVLEQKLLDAHLVRCRSCSHFSAQVAAAAAELRAAALQPLPVPVSVPTRHRPRIYARARMVGAAAAVAAMALGVASRAPLSPGQQQTFPLPRVVDFAGGDLAEQQALRDARREAIVAALAARSRPTGHFGTQPI
jgi:predicted anti-sigma-YlaC factor YlaD